MYNAVTRIQNTFGFFTSVATFVAGLIALTSLLTLPTTNLPSSSALVLRNVQVVKGRPFYSSSKVQEYAHIKFDLDVDLNELFTWNTKQVFLYVTASYPGNQTTAKGTHNPDVLPSKSIIWDAILPHPLAPEHHNQYIYPGENKASKKTKGKKKLGNVKPKKSKVSSAPPKAHVPGLLKLSNQRPKYQISDPTGRLADREGAVLELNYNIQPWVGALTWGTARPVENKNFFNSWIWTQIKGAGKSTDPTTLPSLKDKEQAKKETGDGLGVEKGGEGNRGRPA